MNDEPGKTNNDDKPIIDEETEATVSDTPASDENSTAVDKSDTKCSKEETCNSASCSKGKKCKPLYLVLILLLILCIGSFDYLLTNSWGDKYDPATDLPDGAAIYIELSAPWNDPAISKILDSKSYRFLCTANDGENSWNSIRDTFATQLVDREFNHPALKALKLAFGFDGSTYLGGKVGIGVYAVGSGTPEVAMSMTNFLPVKIGGLKRAMGILPEGFEWKLKRMGSISNPMQVYEIKKDDLTIYVTENGERLLVVTNTNLIQRIADGKTTPISQTTEYQKFGSWNTSSKIRFLFYPEHFINNIANAFTTGSGAASAWKYFNKLFNKIAFDGFQYKWIGLALDTTVASNGEVTVSGKLEAPLNEDTSERATIELPIITDPEAAKILPEDSYFAFCWEKDVSALWEDILRDQSPQELADIKADPTSKIFEQDFFPAMAKVHSLALVPQTLPPEIAKEFPFPSLVLCFGLKDPDTFSDIVYDTVDNFMEDLRAEYEKNEKQIPFIDRRLNYEGVEVNYFEIPDNKVKGAIVPTYIFLDNYWIISTSIEGAKKCIDAVKKNKSLYNSKAFTSQNLKELSPASGWIFFEPRMLGKELNTNATVWNENLVKIRPTDIPLPELRYRPDEQAKYQNEIRLEQFRRKKLLDIYSSTTYNLAPSIAIYRETKNNLIWTFKLNIR